VTAAEVDAPATRTDCAEHPRRAVTVVVIGFATLLVAWILVMPPFDGSDEFDHAYRAAAAARGEWLVTPTDATAGTGAWLEVPRDIVDAAGPECRARSYTTSADCVGTAHGDTVRIASGAGRYHPLFYAAVGAVALPFNGDAALYAMRLATAVLAIALLGLALVAARTWRPRSALLGPVVACSPVVAYSCSIVAPNGLEIMAALGFWCALVGLCVADEFQLRRLTVVAAVAGATLCTLRPLGPFWCLLAGLAVLIAVSRPPGRLRALLARRDVRVAAGVVTLSAVQSVVWTLAMGALKVRAGSPGHTSLAYRAGKAAVFEPLWVLQSIAAFPRRGDATSPAVYLCYLLVFAALMTAGLRCADRRLRIGILVVAAICVMFPFVTTVSSYDAFGVAWQGRYGLPIGVGMVVLAALAIDRRTHPLTGPWLILGGVLFVAAQVVSVGYTLHFEMRVSPLADSSAWVQPPMWLAVAIATVGAVLLWWGMLPGRPRGATHA
jgi:hypothetical protein